MWRLVMVPDDEREGREMHLADVYAGAKVVDNRRVALWRVDELGFYAVSDGRRRQRRLTDADEVGHTFLKMITMSATTFHMWARRAACASGTRAASVASVTGMQASATKSHATL